VREKSNQESISGLTQVRNRNLTPLSISDAKSVVKSGLNAESNSLPYMCVCFNLSSG